MVFCELYCNGPIRTTAQYVQICTYWAQNIEIYSKIASSAQYVQKIF